MSINALLEKLTEMAEEIKTGINPTNIKVISILFLKVISRHLLYKEVNKYKL
jgi:hypothetical protein